MIVPVLVAAAFIIKLAPSFMFVKSHGMRNAIASGVLLSARLSLLIAAIEIGLAAGIESVEQYAASLILLALIMCIAAPIGFRILYRPPPEEEVAEDVEPIYELIRPEGG
jgi:Kef-type K+ transport system membrane component KefB